MAENGEGRPSRGSVGGRRSHQDWQQDMAAKFAELQDLCDTEVQRKSQQGLADVAAAAPRRSFRRSGRLSVTLPPDEDLPEQQQQQPPQAGLAERSPEESNRRSLAKGRQSVGASVAVDESAPADPPTRPTTGRLTRRVQIVDAVETVSPGRTSYAPRPSARTPAPRTSILKRHAQVGDGVEFPEPRTSTGGGCPRPSDVMVARRSGELVPAAGYKSPPTATTANGQTSADDSPNSPFRPSSVIEITPAPESFAGETPRLSNKSGASRPRTSAATPAAQMAPAAPPTPTATPTDIAAKAPPRVASVSKTETKRNAAVSSATRVAMRRDRARRAKEAGAAGKKKVEPSPKHSPPPAVVASHPTTPFMARFRRSTGTADHRSPLTTTSPAPRVRSARLALNSPAARSSESARVLPDAAAIEQVREDPGNPPRPKAWVFRFDGGSAQLPPPTAPPVQPKPIRARPTGMPRQTLRGKAHRTEGPAAPAAAGGSLVQAKQNTAAGGSLAQAKQNTAAVPVRPKGVNQAQGAPTTKSATAQRPAQKAPRSNEVLRHGDAPEVQRVVAAFQNFDGHSLSAEALALFLRLQGAQLDGVPKRLELMTRAEEILELAGIV